jgi:tRNA modification GTPase
MLHQDNIVALATAPGTGAIAVIRISGPDSWEIAASVFHSAKGKDLRRQRSHTLHLGLVVDGGKEIDQVLASVFKGPNSYSGEDTVEISCHGSAYIQQQIIQLLLRKGCRMASPGEFTLRAFLNGKLDLSQAEAVADLISSGNEASHQIAMQQMRGGFSGEIAKLREELLNFASLIELELDFSEEDVEFADRSQFTALLNRIENVLKRLIDSFAVGNVIKNGIPVAIAGEPNVGKSTLLNALLNEERAIVSDIAGTTRDAIEDEISVGGIGFRFIDTAGIRETRDAVETIGIRKTFEKMDAARVVIYLVDAGAMADAKKLGPAKSEIGKIRDQYPAKPLLLIGNKADKLDAAQKQKLQAEFPEILLISAKNDHGTDELKSRLLSMANAGTLHSGEPIVTNSRHYDALLKALEEIQKVKHGLQSGIPADLMAIDIRQALYHFGEITGQVSSDELLGNIFANFCIGK